MRGPEHSTRAVYQRSNSVATSGDKLQVAVALEGCAVGHDDAGPHVPGTDLLATPRHIQRAITIAVLQAEQETGSAETGPTDPEAELGLQVGIFGGVGDCEVTAGSDIRGYPFALFSLSPPATDERPLVGGTNGRQGFRFCGHRSSSRSGLGRPAPRGQGGAPPLARLPDITRTVLRQFPHERSVVAATDCTPANLLIKCSYLGSSVHWVSRSYPQSCTCRRSMLRARKAHWNSAASMVSPGPNPSATHGMRASESSNRSRMNARVADDMFP